MEKICENTQELIALGQKLSGQAEEHCRSCEKCSRLKEEYQMLTFLVSDSGDCEVPSGFSEAVMNQIEIEDRSIQTDWLEKCVTAIDKILSIPQAQYLALGLGGVVSLFNLAKFVFFVLIPVQ